LTISPQDISIIIPVKNNQPGIDAFLTQFFLTHSCEHYPRELIIIDNNSVKPIVVADCFHREGLEIRVSSCAKPGPAAARNQGATQAGGAWLLFVDSDCIPTDTFIPGYLTANSNNVAYQGAVGAVGADCVSNYYVSQQIHQPPQTTDEFGLAVPKCLVSANILVLKTAFKQIDGFDDAFIFGGEDIDFGLRLSKLGRLDYAPNAKVLHCFDDGLLGFIRRFYEYGKGNRQVQQHHDIQLFPLPFRAKQRRVLINHALAILQWCCLFSGYVAKDLEFRTSNH